MRILCVQWAAIGDLVLTTPALAALREAHPAAHIGLLTSAFAAPVVAGTGLVDTIYTLPRTSLLRGETLHVFRQIRRDRYDAIIFFHHLTTRAGAYKYAALAYASGAPRRIGLDNGRGWFLNEKIPDTGFGPENQAQEWLNLVALLGADASPRGAKVAFEPYPLPDADFRIAVHAGSGDFSTARRWPVERLAQTVNMMTAEYQAQVVVVGAAGDDSPALIEKLDTPPLDLTGKTSIPQLADALRQCQLYIGSDSGVSHLAAAADTPSVAVFGPTNHAAWSPWSPQGRAVVVRTNPACAPCFYVDNEVGSRTGCAALTCLKMVTPEMVASAARAVIAGPVLQPPVVPRRQPREGFPMLHILGIPVHGLTYPQLLAQIAAWIAADDGAHHINTINPEFMMVAQEDPVFRHMLRRADLCVPDGVGLLWAARHLGTPLPERITGSDGLPIIAERAAQEGWLIYLLGAADGIAERAAQELVRRHPALKIAGTYGGSPRPEDEADIVARVNAARPDILFLAYGTPAQEKWIARNLPRLASSVVIGVGGAFDFVAGSVPRAPMWMRRTGIEWLYRLYLQPWRIKRMSRLPRFVLAVLRLRHKGSWEI